MPKGRARAPANLVVRPCIGQSTPTASKAFRWTDNNEDTTLRAAAVASGYISAEEFDGIVRPAAMVGLA
ncbi:hypothetical protein [Streptomyces sp. NPDC058545]|uniref:hypothetical protein n=1 Tax=Streptomyces sp. NPDC058545 TaxID=3346544 RepID=UPI0036519506